MGERYGEKKRKRKEKGYGDEIGRGGIWESEKEKGEWKIDR